MLVTADPTVIELREWSRIAEDLNVERNRLTNRMREQLWRYFPAMLDLESKLGAAWLDRPLGARAHANKAARIAKPAFAGRRWKVEAAAAHIASASALWIRQLKDTHPKLDVLTVNLASSVQVEPGQTKQHDAERFLFEPAFNQHISRAWFQGA
ncbi:MAG: hypothetical protein WCC41_17015 [Rhodomicrobium sp.]